MRVRLLKPWGNYRMGELFNPQPNMGRILIGRGLALEVPETPHGNAVQKNGPKAATTNTDVGTGLPSGASGGRKRRSRIS